MSAMTSIARILRFTAAAMLAGLCAVATGAMAGERVNVDDSNVAILGYDPVAYFTEGRPTPGSPEFEHVWHDARWLFASAENRALFASDPEHYAPRYGGYCSGAMALGWRSPVDPQAWVIIDDKLYLNFAVEDVPEFVADSENQIQRADANWVRLGHAE